MELREHMPNIPLNSDLVELQDLALVAELIIRCAFREKRAGGFITMWIIPKRTTTTG